MILLLFLLKSFLTSISPNVALDNSQFDIISTPKDPLYASVEFDTKLIISDTLCEGDVAYFKYQLTNTGNTSVHISSVRSSCGCYVPTWPKKPILSGDTAEIISRYTSYYRPGPFNRSMTLVFNGNESFRTVLYVKGYTKPKSQCQN